MRDPEPLKQTCANQGNKNTGGNTPPATIIWARGFCSLPSSLSLQWTIASFLSSTWLAQRKDVLFLFSILHRCQLPKPGQAQAEWGPAQPREFICLFSRSRACPLSPVAQLWDGCLHAGLLAWSLLPSPNLKSLLIQTTWLDVFQMGTNASLKPCPVASLPFSFPCQISHWHCKNEILELINVMAINKKIHWILGF